MDILFLSPEALCDFLLCSLEVPKRNLSLSFSLAHTHSLSLSLHPPVLLSSLLSQPLFGPLSCTWWSDYLDTCAGSLGALLLFAWKHFEEEEHMFLPFGFSSFNIQIKDPNVSISYTSLKIWRYVLSHLPPLTSLFLFFQLVIRLFNFKTKPDQIKMCRDHARKYSTLLTGWDV